MASECYYALSDKTGLHDDAYEKTPNAFIGRQLGYHHQAELLRRLRSSDKWESSRWEVSRCAGAIPMGDKPHRCLCRYCKLTFMSPVRGREVCEGLSCTSAQDAEQQDKSAAVAAAKRIASRKTKPYKLSPIDLFVMGKPFKKLGD